MATFPETTTLQDFYDRALWAMYEGVAVNPGRSLYYYGSQLASYGERPVTGEIAEAHVGSYPSYTWTSLYERWVAGRTLWATFLEGTDEEGVSYANYTLEELYAATDGAGFGSSIVDPAGTGDAAFVYSVAINSPATTVTGEFAGATAGPVLGLETELGGILKGMLSGIGSWAYGNNGYIISYGNPLGGFNLIWEGGWGTLGSGKSAELASYLGAYNMGIYREHLLIGGLAGSWHSLLFSVSSFAAPTFEAGFDVGATFLEEADALHGGVGGSEELGAGVAGISEAVGRDLLFSEGFAEGRTKVTYDGDEIYGLRNRFGWGRRLPASIIDITIRDWAGRIIEGDTLKAEKTFNSIKTGPYINEDTTAIMGEEAEETVEIGTLRATTSTDLAPTTSAAAAWSPMARGADWGFKWSGSDKPKSTDETYDASTMDTIFAGTGDY